MHHTKTKADIAVGYVVAHLTEQQWNVGILITEHAKYDLLAEKDGVCVRVQVKYCSPTKNVLNVGIRNSWADTHGSHCSKRKDSDYDVLAVYSPEGNSVYFLNEIDFKECTTMVTLKLDSEAKKKNQGKIRIADDFKILRACSLDGQNKTLLKSRP